MHMKILILKMSLDGGATHIKNEFVAGSFELKMELTRLAGYRILARNLKLYDIADKCKIDIIDILSDLVGDVYKITVSDGNNEIFVYGEKL